VDRGPWTVDRGPWTVDRGPWTVDPWTFQKSAQSAITISVVFSCSLQVLRVFAISV
jgi:hypothetical protein